MSDQRGANIPSEFEGRLTVSTDALGIDASADKRIEQNRLSRVPSFCAISAAGWGTFGVFYFIRGALPTAAICAPVALILIALGYLSYRYASRRKRIASLQLAVNVIGLTGEIFISGLSSSSSVAFLCCIGIMAAHQSGPKVAIKWTALCVAIVVALHFAFEPSEWLLLRHDSVFDHAVAVSGVFLLVTWMAANAEWLATKYLILINENAHKLSHIAQHDQLTQLANRYRFRAELDEAKEEYLKNGTHFGLLMLDLDSFKRINDSLGHVIGDIVLKEVASRLVHLIGDADTIARVGGDEFIVIVREATRERLEQLSDRIVEAFEDPVTVDDRKLPMSISGGAAILPDDTECIDELQVFADLAIYAAKRSSRSIAIYESVMSERNSRRQLLIERLSTAVDNDEFQLVYQPQVDLNDGKVIGVEALLRWSYVDPVTQERKNVSPVEFVPILESTGEINCVGRWVLDEACKQARIWFDAGIGCCVSVNVSPIQFRSPGLVDDVMEALEQTSLPPNLLDLEITEGVMVDQFEDTQDKLHCLKSAGITISVDDFGTGYSSLAYLKHLSIDRLKIDRMFVKDIPETDDGSIASSVIALARSLDLDVLAEGVETDEQLRFLQQADCESYQGYFYSKPVSAEECTKLLMKDKRPCDDAKRLVTNR